MNKRLKHSLFFSFAVCTFKILQNYFGLLFFVVFFDIICSISRGLDSSTLQKTSITLQATLGIGQKSLTLVSSTDPDALLTYTNNDVTLTIYYGTVGGFGFKWSSSGTSTVFQDCVVLSRTKTQWFGGYLQPSLQTQNLKIETLPFVTTNVTPIMEPYFVNTNGAFVFVNETTPLFIDQNNLRDDQLCLIAKLEEPYNKRSSVTLNHTLASFGNITEAHLAAINNLVGRHAVEPNADFFKFNVWSTWPKYKNDVNDANLQRLAEDLHGNGFRGEIQVEDGWESCYGSLTYNRSRLPQIDNTLAFISSHALWTSFAIHPFINTECDDLVKTGRREGYFVKNDKGDDIISWYNGQSAHMIDFTNENATLWFSERVAALQGPFMQGYGFVGGEVSWISAIKGASGQGDPDKWPNQLTSIFNSKSNVTFYAHVTSGWRTQFLPVLTRIPEKLPNWSKKDGLASVIINLLQSNILGYTMVLPPIIGGIGIQPSPELFVRWVQATAFMPVMHWGYLPWEIISYDYDVMEIVKTFTDLHSWNANKIKNVCIKSRTMGLPVNGPIWWIDPTNSDLYDVDDEFMLSDDFLIAPVIVEGARSRDVVLPNGVWEDGNNGTKYNGGQVLNDYPAPIDVLPYFIKEKS